MKTLASLVALSLAAAASNAAITGNTGATTYLGTPPVNAQQFNLTGATAYCWNEQSGITSSATLVNLNTPGTYTGPTPNVAVIGGTFDSHFIHFDPSPNAAVIIGSVTFSAAIRGVIYNNTLLSISDPVFGFGGTTYDTGNPLRSFTTNALGPNVISYAGNTINFLIGTGFPGQQNRMDEIRVLTDVVPTPGTGSLALAGALLAARRRR